MHGIAAVSVWALSRYNFIWRREVMKTTKISQLPVRPEEYGEHFEPNFQDTDMTKEERLFVSGLIKFYAPENILEVGVAGGGNSVNILNTIQKMENAKLISVDITDVFYHPFVGKIKVGEFVYQYFQEIPKGKWELLVGEDPSVRVEKLNKKFDFLILDTAHAHPIESLNFLSVLPYLNENAIVILHDITLYMDMLNIKGKLDCFATGILNSVICAEKLLPEIVGFGGYTNIMAFQISADTKKYIRNVFDSLMLPWEYLPGNIGDIGSFIHRHYSNELKNLFRKAFELNLMIQIRKNKQISNVLLSKLRENKVIFYGAGKGMEEILSLLRANEYGFDFPIWDVNAKEISRIRDYQVVEPDFISRAAGQVIIVSIKDYEIYKNICTKLETLGYIVVHGLNGYCSNLLNLSSQASERP